LAKFRLVKANYFRYNLTRKNDFRRIKMANLATTKMSSKGQVVIPEDIRNRLNLKAGSQFVVVGEKDVVIFKSISQPSMEEFDKLIAEARRQAKEAGLKKSDVYKAVAKARGRK
jgi:AbrB family looped-hinge helix DNA binding protein